MALVAAMSSSVISEDAKRRKAPGWLKIRYSRLDTATAFDTFVATGNYKNMEEGLRALLIEKGLLKPDLPRTY